MKYEHSSSELDGFGHSTIRGKNGLSVSVSGGHDVIEHAVIGEAVQGAVEYLNNYRQYQCRRLQLAEALLREWPKAEHDLSFINGGLRLTRHDGIHCSWYRWWYYAGKKHERHGGDFPTVFDAYVDFFDRRDRGEFGSVELDDKQML